MACAFSDRNRRESESSVRNNLPPKLRTMAKGHHANARSSRENFRLLYDFFRGHGRQVATRSLDLSSVSSFRRRVYDVLCRIPRGRVTTYGEIARGLGGVKYARAVGTAVATNPLPLIIPCHRVVPFSFEVGNYGMGGREPSSGGYMKRQLLEREGVKFRGRRVSQKSRWIPN